MMLISTAGAPGLQRQRAVNCCLWASETFPVSGGPSPAPAAPGRGEPASARVATRTPAPQRDVVVIPAAREPGKVPACLMACLPSEGWAAGGSGGENLSPLQG